MKKVSKDRFSDKYTFNVLVLRSKYFYVLLLSKHWVGVLQNINFKAFRTSYFADFQIKIQIKQCRGQ